MRYLVRQKNGLLAEYSTICDDITYHDMTEDEYLSLCISRVVEDEIKRIKNELRRDVLSPETFFKEFIKEHPYYLDEEYKEFNQLMKELFINEETD